MKVDLTLSLFQPKKIIGNGLFYFDYLQKKVQLPLSDFLTPLASKTVAGVKLLFLMTLEVAHFYPPASNRPYCASVRPLKTTFEFLLECFVKRSTASYIFKFIKLDQSLCISDIVLYHLIKKFNSWYKSCFCVLLRKSCNA